MTRSAVLGLSALLLASVGCGPSWPQARGFTDTSVSRVRTIDVLPSDVQIWTHSKAKISAPEIAQDFDGQVVGLLSGMIARRGYQVAAHVDWNGRYLSKRGLEAQAMEPQQVAETAFALSGYGVALERTDLGTADVPPHLPHRLGEVTGSDATLYVGGWAYAGKDGMSTGSKVLLGVGIALVAVVVVVAVIAALDGKGGGGGLGGLGKGVAKGVAGVGKGAAKVAGRAVGGIGRVAVHAARGTTRVMAHMAKGMANSNIQIHIDADAIDCFGRADTHVDWYAGRPDYYEQQATPKKGRSASLIEMTLVDNRRGVVLWHARQRFPGNPSKPEQVDKMLKSLVASLPPAS